MRLLFNDRDLDAPFRTQNPFTLKLLDRFFAELLPEHLPAASRSDDVRASPCCSATANRPLSTEPSAAGRARRPPNTPPASGSPQAAVCVMDPP
jgi:hypothetical protein